MFLWNTIKYLKLIPPFHSNEFEIGLDLKLLTRWVIRIILHIDLNKFTRLEDYGLRTLQIGAQFVLETYILTYQPPNTCATGGGGGLKYFHWKLFIWL